MTDTDCPVSDVSCRGGVAASASTPHIRHWGPAHPDGASCRFCENPPYPHIRSSEDAAEFFRCHDARWPVMWTKLRGIVHAFG